MHKTELRKKLLQKRLVHETKAKIEKDLIIVNKIKRLKAFKEAKTVLLYLPIHGEVNLQDLLEKKPANKNFVLPRVKDKGLLHLFYVKDLTDVEKGSFNILEPKRHLKKAFLKSIDLVLVPGIAFSLDGHRIGYGKGFYDRLLKKIKAARIGIAYEFQIVDNIPCEPHDTGMDMIVTEKEIHHIINK